MTHFDPPLSPLYFDPLRPTSVTYLVYVLNTDPPRVNTRVNTRIRGLSVHRSEHKRVLYTGRLQSGYSLSGYSLSGYNLKLAYTTERRL